MNIQFLISSLFFSLALCSSLFTSPLPHATPPSSKGYKRIQCTIKPVDRKTESGSHTRIPGPKRANRAQASSTNWSGYAAATDMNNPAANSVSAVYGSWIVPKIQSSKTNSYCAFWVGIDGYSNATVEQIGTSHNYINGKQQHYAWFEMYPENSYMLVGFPLAVGDVISASVVYAGDGVFTLSIQNDTQQLTTTIPASYTTSADAERSSAEWVVEAPYLNGILPLSNFGYGYLWGCLATINGVLASLNNSSWENISIEMVTNNGTSKAAPSLPLQDNGSFFMTWAHR